MENIPDCDIVLPVYNGLTYVKECLDSILKNTKSVSYQLYIVDDCSDLTTGTYLSTVAKNYPQITLKRNNQNLGFVRSCNHGISLGGSPYVVLINSDVIVTADWLFRLLRCAKSDQRIASVNPLTNHAANINIPMASGANFYGMDEFLRSNSQKRYPNVVTGVGFCLLLRRACLDKVGLFDEIFGRGYCEESDLCMRLTTNGYRTVVADDVYVYHKGCVSFKDRNKRYKKNRKIFDKRWRREYREQFRNFNSAAPLKPARELFRIEREWDPIPAMRETFRRLRNRFHQGKYFELILETERGIRRLMRAKRDIPTAESVARVTRSDRLRVTYVLPYLTLAGGVISVVQIVNELILLGVEARIVALRDYPEVYDWNFYTRPIIFKSVSEMLRSFPTSDIAVATHWTTAPWVHELVRQKKAKLSVYFIQDYESWFYPENDQVSRKKVKETYKLIQNKIVKSNWLQSLLAENGHNAIKISLGLNLSIFYPRDIEKRENPVVVAMARPRTPRRGFIHTIEALRLVKKKMPKVNIVLFGDYLKIKRVPFEFRYEGIIPDQDKIAELYSAADVFLDGSDFQGFGRTALEAMACGAACVLTNIGGVNEYARDEKNCLLVTPKKPKIFANTIIRILKDKCLMQNLVMGGLNSAKGYCHKREAKETLDYFKLIAR